MKKHVLVLAMAASMAVLAAYGSMPGMRVTQAPTTEAAKTGAAKAGEAQSGDSKTEMSAPAADDKVYTLKISTPRTDQSLIIQAYVKFADRVRENSNGHLEIEVFPSSQLGSDEDVTEQVIQGAGIAMSTGAARMGTYVRDVGTLMMGYFADNYEECRRITETDTFKGQENELTDKHRVRVLAFDFYNRPRRFTTNKEVKTLEDLEGLRIRTVGTEVCTESIGAMGETPIAMAWGKVYNGIRSKTLDACGAQNTSTYPSRIYEVCKYQTKTSRFQLLQALAYGESRFKSLPGGLQKILADTTRKVGAESAADILTGAENCEKKMVEAGLTIVEPGVEAFKTAMEPAYERLGYTELHE